MRTTFRALLSETSGDELRRRSNGTRWTNRQLLFHMLLGFLIMRALVGLARIVARPTGWAVPEPGCSTPARNPSTPSTSPAPGSAGASCPAARCSRCATARSRRCTAASIARTTSAWRRACPTRPVGTRVSASS
ncbi:hypothetical protein [Lentzea terrae]|uniref:hypothetical protein n=1 Tax=Lentzea terrae TaxID=2200761 RepID=UPI000DD2BB12